MDNLDDIQSKLKAILRGHVPILKVRHDLTEKFEVAGTKEAMQGKKKVDGYYFASVIPKPKDIRLYYFPIYTHPDAFVLSDQLKKCLKGKSCFHIKKMDDELEKEIVQMISKGTELYIKDGLI